MNSFKVVGSFSIIVFLLFVTVGLVSTFSANAEEDLQPVGKITIDEKQVNIIIGHSWGKGVLSYKGVDYGFKVKGFKVGAVGVAKVSAVGHVYNLNDCDCIIIITFILITWMP